MEGGGVGVDWWMNWTVGLCSYFRINRGQLGIHSLENMGSPWELCSHHGK